MGLAVADTAHTPSTHTAHTEKGHTPMSNTQLLKPKTVDSAAGKVPLTPDGIPDLDAWVREDADQPPFACKLGGKVRSFLHPKDLPISNLKRLLAQDPELSLASIVCAEDRAEVLELDMSFGKFEAIGNLYQEYYGLDQAVLGNGSASPS